jgi:DNA-binding LacI/PurR family transcriptional regulator
MGYLPEGAPAYPDMTAAAFLDFIAAIRGFDGIARPAGASLLSTVQIPYHQIGLTGGKRLLDLAMKRYDSHQHILLDCDLRGGDTLAVPPAGVA